MRFTMFRVYDEDGGLVEEKPFIDTRKGQEWADSWIIGNGAPDEEFEVIEVGFYIED